VKMTTKVAHAVNLENACSPLHPPVIEIPDNDSCTGFESKQDDKRRGKKRKSEDPPTPESREDVCSICLEAFKGKTAFTTDCGHKFHFVCIKQSIGSGNYACPLCRKEFTEDNSPCPLMKEADFISRAMFAHRPHHLDIRPTLSDPGNLNFTISRLIHSFRAQHPPMHPRSVYSRREVAHGSPAADQTQAPKTINHWKLVLDTKVIKGRVYNYPGLVDGEPISTSPVVRVRGRTVVTLSGSIYVLGTPDPDFLNTLELYEEENPLACFNFPAV